MPPIVIVHNMLYASQDGLAIRARVYYWVLPTDTGIFCAVYNCGEKLTLARVLGIQKENWGNPFQRYILITGKLQFKKKGKKKPFIALYFPTFRVIV